MSGWEGAANTETSGPPLTSSLLKYIALSEPDMSAVFFFSLSWSHRKAMLRCIPPQR
jgi:hypothetical protein